MTVASNVRRIVPVPPRPVRLVHAPAWFHSALAFLGYRFRGADGTLQAFAPVLAGSDVDPYAQLGATKLFVIQFNWVGFPSGRRTHAGIGRGADRDVDDLSGNRRGYRRDV